MTAIPHAAEALTSALSRFGHASSRMLGAANGATDDTDQAAAVIDMMEAKTQVKAAVAVVRFSDEMYQALLDIGRPTQGR
ncbi:hypothetical protein [Terricaulis sp.]|uniref:hypothetical protein n=1 Tax=Terricaulis sp. TaxID=2768686 RepID=UPI00378395FE